MQSWGLLHLQTLFLSDQKFLSVSLSFPKQPTATKTSNHCTRKTKNQQERKAHHQCTCRHQKNAHQPSAREDAGSLHLLSRMPMLSHQGGSVLEEQFFDLFIMKKVSMARLQVVEKLYYWSTDGFIYSVHVTVTELYTSIFLLKLYFPKMFCQGEYTYKIIFHGPLNASACLAFLWPFWDSKIADHPTPVNFLCK